MYKIIRRISSSFFPRPDRPWSEDATSNAPQIGRKRRLSSTEPDPDGEPSVAKKPRGDSADASEDASQREESPARAQGQETAEVKNVTKGVRDVELEESKAEVSEPVADADAAAIPLPESPTLQPAPEAETEAVPSEELPAGVAQECIAEKLDASEDTSLEPNSSTALSNDAQTSEEIEGVAKRVDEQEEIPGLTASAEKKTPEAIFLTKTTDDTSNAAQSTTQPAQELSATAEAS
ncbi:hypothetical protein IEO21_08562 [Rhodonia placenta]|uniref:Uncharacterized protein n=1 Tax=Rhodonia placenta TaxID=104341 RepID=A0A8H7TZ97_9APHY|nr:hypothetical protein IEO21_08562 [Postia placenta]